MHKFQNQIIAMIFLIITLAKYGQSFSKPGCYDLLTNYSRSLGSFMDCAGLHSRPFDVCNECSEYFSNLNHLKSKLIVGNCGHGVVYRGISFDYVTLSSNTVDKIWNTAFCDECFSKGVYSADYEKYITYSTGLSNCLKQATPWKYLYGKLPPPFEGVCNECRPYLNNLTKLRFNKCIEIHDNTILFMSMWNNYYGCKNVQSFPRWVNYFSLVVLFLLIVANYGLVLLFVKPVREKILKRNVTERSVLLSTIENCFNIEKYWSINLK